MSLIRVKHNRENPFVQLNKKSIWDSDLSLKAVGLLVRCMSRPDDWVFSVAELIKSCKEGRTAIYSAIDELIKHGYAMRLQYYGNKEDKTVGFQKMEYYFFEFKLTDEEKEKYEQEFKKNVLRSGFLHTQNVHAGNQQLLINKANNKEKAASSRPKTDPLKFEHEIYQSDKELYDKVIKWYMKTYAKKTPRSKLAVLKSCISNKWYEEEFEEQKENQHEASLNAQYAHEIQKRYQKTNRPPGCDFKALKNGISFIAGAKEVTIPSYDMPHEIFKSMVKDIFESRGIWDEIMKVKL